MNTVTRPADITADPPPPNITKEFVALLEAAAAERGLLPDPWPLP